MADEWLREHDIPDAATLACIVLAFVILQFPAGSRHTAIAISERRIRELVDVFDARKETLQ